MSTPKSFVNPNLIQHNASLVAWARTLITLIAGLITGFCGITGIWGLAAYLIAHVLVSVALLVRMGFAPSVYFVDASPISFIASSIFDNVLLFIVAWALGYGANWVF